jgi:hypothetical protein
MSSLSIEGCERASRVADGNTVRVPWFFGKFADQTHRDSAMIHTNFHRPNPVLEI